MLEADPPAFRRTANDTAHGTEALADMFEALATKLEHFVATVGKALLPEEVERLNRAKELAWRASRLALQVGEIPDFVQSRNRTNTG
jgi:hypothetical protein